MSLFLCVILFYNLPAKRRSFKHLNAEQPAQTEVRLKQNIPKTKIAEATGVTRSTLYREIERGTGEQIDINLKKYKNMDGT